MDILVLTSEGFVFVCPIILYHICRCVYPIYFSTIYLDIVMLHFMIFYSVDSEVYKTMITLSNIFLVKFMLVHFLILTEHVNSIIFCENIKICLITLLKQRPLNNIRLNIGNNLKTLCQS